MSFVCIFTDTDFPKKKLGRLETSYGTSRATWCQSRFVPHGKNIPKLGFLVRKYHDLTTTKVIKVLEEAANRHDHSKSDCFVCAFSSHGQEKPRAETGMHKAIVQVMEHYIYTRDSEIRTSDIISMFDDKNCPSLKNKPKLFFVQACRSRGGGCDSFDRGHHVKIYEESIQTWKRT
ncbi:hypothetical protein ScPMuIL_014840 [Solemya velum]